MTSRPLFQHAPQAGRRKRRRACQARLRAHASEQAGGLTSTVQAAMSAPPKKPSSEIVQLWNCRPTNRNVRLRDDAH
eukprot:1201642-Rhodomonas_salina.1